jgi:Raf kinase inhibitor-like YbhB/YbcL family protein
LAFNISSSAFENEGFLPGWYCAAGLNASPPFGWIDEPEDSRSLALVCTAEDGRCHWVVWNIPPDMHTIYGKQPRNSVLENGIRQGWNSFGVSGWTGPEKKKSNCRLVFNLMALDSALELPADTDGDELNRACQGHVLATASIACRYC